MIGQDLGNNIHELHRNSGAGLVIGILALLWGSQGASQAGQYAMAQIWNVPNVVAAQLLGQAGPDPPADGAPRGLPGPSTGLTVLAGIVGSTHLGWRVAAIAASAVLNVVVYCLTFRILTPKQVRDQPVAPGRRPRRTGLDGPAPPRDRAGRPHPAQRQPGLRFFAVVLGLVFWIYLVSEVSLYVAAGINVVRGTGGSGPGPSSNRRSPRPTDGVL